MNQRINRSIRVAEPVLDGNEALYVMDCLQSTWISSRGSYIDRFEKLLAEHCQVPFAVVTNNGTTSLHLALTAAGVGAGDEVIMPTLSYIATANAAHYCQAKPVFVDCEPNYLSMDPGRIEDAITPRTKAILTVPLYGHPVDIDPIREIADRHGLLLIEDSAEAIGALYKGRPVGSLADASSFSFFGNKTITTGEGGAITTADEQLRLTRDYFDALAAGVSPGFAAAFAREFAFFVFQFFLTACFFSGEFVGQLFLALFLLLRQRFNIFLHTFNRRDRALQAVELAGQVFHGFRLIFHHAIQRRELLQ